MLCLEYFITKKNAIDVWSRFPISNTNAYIINNGVSFFFTTFCEAHFISVFQ